MVEFVMVGFNDKDGRVVSLPPAPLPPRPNQAPQDRRCQTLRQSFVRRIRYCIATLPAQKLLDRPDPQTARPCQRACYAVYRTGDVFTRFLPSRIKPYADLVFVHFWITGLFLAFAEAFLHTVNILAGYGILLLAHRSEPAWQHNPAVVALTGAFGAVLVHAALFLLSLPVLLYIFHIRDSLAPHAAQGPPTISVFEWAIIVPLALVWNCARAAAAAVAGTYMLRYLEFDPAPMSVSYALSASVTGALVVFVPRVVAVKLALWARARDISARARSTGGARPLSWRVHEDFAIGELEKDAESING